MTKHDKDAALLALVIQFDKLRTECTRLTKEKDECSIQIKGVIGDRLDVPVDGYRVSYHYDSDKDVTRFDEKSFEKKDAKGFARYTKLVLQVQELQKLWTKTTTVAGGRRLIIQSTEDE